METGMEARESLVLDTDYLRWEYVAEISWSWEDYLRPGCQRRCLVPTEHTWVITLKN